MVSKTDSGTEQHFQRAVRNHLGLVGKGWVLWHSVFFFWDALALKEIILMGKVSEDLLSLQSRGSGSAQSYSLFGVHSQFIGFWSVVLSVMCHLLTLRAMLSVEPYPETFTIRERERRDKVYLTTARVAALAACFCPTASLCDLVLYTMNEREWSWDRGGGGWFPYLYVDTVIPLEKLVFLVVQVPRHWSCGPGRFISRKGGRFFEVDLGQSRVHTALFLYMSWLAVCRIRNGVWAYSTMADLEVGAGTRVNHLFQLWCISISVQIAGWVSWFCAASVAPKPIL